MDTTEVKKKRGREGKLIEFDGRSQTALQWAAEIGIDVKSIYKRLSDGEPLNRVHKSTQRAKTLTLGDKTMSIKAWAEHLGIGVVTIYRRLSQGMSLDKVLTSEKHKTGVAIGHHFNHRAPRAPRVYQAEKITHNGESLSVLQWARKLGIKPGTIRSRLYSGLSVEEALNTDYIKAPPRRPAEEIRLNFRCHVCCERIRKREIVNNRYVKNGRFKKAHVKCFAAWTKIQKELNVGRVKRPVDRGQNDGV